VTRLDDPLRAAVGPKTADALHEAFGHRTLRDLMWHLPRRYLERGECSDLRDLRVGEHATLIAEVRSGTIAGPPGKERAELTVGAGDRLLRLTFFRQGWRVKQLTVGTQALFAGPVSSWRGQLQMTNPKVMMLPGRGGGERKGEERWARAVGGGPLPIYPAAKEIESWRIADSTAFVATTLDIADEDDPLPAELREREDLPSLRDALVAIHVPQRGADIELARRRLVWDEALLTQVALAQRRADAARQPATPRPPVGGGLLEAFDADLPYSLTQGQRAVGAELAADLARRHPMLRLLQGEVGSGKTVCAMRAVLQVVDAGGQAVLLAPTEVLAQQHLRSVRALLGPIGRAGELDGGDRATAVALLTGSTPAAQRRATLEQIRSGAAGLVIGTHALLEDAVSYADLGLVVVDEQHRFGVEQRDRLRSRRAADGSVPHLLVMTATPIPRTVAMTVFGDLATSELTELPGGRQPITSHVVLQGQPRWVARMWELVREEVAVGHRAFVVCPRISAADDAEATAPQDDAGPARVDPGAAVEEVLPALAAGELAGLRIGALHGRLPTEEKEAVMAAFARGDLDVLVATTVIEVGVDVPDATVMVVLDAQRFGISQLHQLRGRVGRGSAASTCLLHTSSRASSSTFDRLMAVAATTDGKVLAELDLRTRREGDVLGVAQSGTRRTLRVLDLLRHGDVIAAAKTEAQRIVDADQGLERHPALAASLAAALAGAADYLDKS